MVPNQQIPSETLSYTARVQTSTDQDKLRHCKLQSEHHICVQFSLNIRKQLTWPPHLICRFIQACFHSLSVIFQCDIYSKCICLWCIYYSVYPVTLFPLIHVILWEVPWSMVILCKCSVFVDSPVFVSCKVSCCVQFVPSVLWLILVCSMLDCV